MLESSNDRADKYFSLTVGQITDRHQVVRIGATEQLPLDSAAQASGSSVQQPAAIAQDSLDDWF